MNTDTSKARLPEDICPQIFGVSTAMIGVCLTVIGLIRVVISIRSIDTVADDFLAADAIIFLLSCFLSYWALRKRSQSRMYRLECIADAIFLLGLLLMSAVCGYITYAIA